MPPRYAYWTILIDGKATAFRAKEREELLPTLNQLRRKNTDVTLRYFARGKLWDSPEQAQWAGRNTASFGDKRDQDWRPGGEHKDPRARFDKKPKQRDGARPFRNDQRDNDRHASDRNERRDSRQDRRPPGGDRPWGAPKGEHRDRTDQRSRKPFSGQQDQNARSFQDRPREGRPGAGRFENRDDDRSNSREGLRGESGRKPWTPTAPHGDWRDREQRQTRDCEQRDTRDRERRDTRDRGDRPRPEGTRPFGPPKGEGEKRPWSGKPAGRKPWTPKAPHGDWRDREQRQTRDREQRDTRDRERRDTRDRGDRPRPESTRPFGPPKGEGEKRPWSGKRAGRKPWTPKPSHETRDRADRPAPERRAWTPDGGKGQPRRFDDHKRDGGPKRFDDRSGGGASKRFDDRKPEREKAFKDSKGQDRHDRFESRARENAKNPFREPKGHPGRFEEPNRTAPPKGLEREAPRPTPAPRREEPPAREERPERPPSAEQVIPKPEPPERG